jgi:hypothetical protein
MKWGNNTRWNSFRPVFEPIAGSGKIHGIQVKDSVHAESMLDRVSLEASPLSNQEEIHLGLRSEMDGGLKRDHGISEA